MKPPHPRCRSGTASVLSRRRFLQLASVTAGAIALQACSGTRRTPASPDSEKVQLVYQDSRSDWFLPMVQAMLAQFQAEHPNLQVFFTPEPDGPTQIQTETGAAMQAGTAPDVFSGCCSWFPIWAQKGYALDLRPFIEADLQPALIDDWDPAHFRALRSRDGAQFGVPNFHGGLALYYNKDLFDQYGVAYPDGSWTHDDYLEAMRRLTHDRDGDGQIDLWGSQTYISWDRLQVHVNGWGGHFVDPDDPTRVRMGEPEALAAIEWLRARMWDDRVMATPLDVKKNWPDDVFLAQQIAMLEDGSWRLKHILSKATFRLGVAPFPAGPVRRVTLGTSDGYGIYAGSQHPEAAWELVKFLVSQDYGRALAREGLLQPARASLLGEWVEHIRAAYPDKTKDVDLMAFADGHLNGYSVVGETAANMEAATQIAAEAWDRVLTLGTAPVSIVAEAARQIQAAQHDA